MNSKSKNEQHSNLNESMHTKSFYSHKRSPGKENNSKKIAAKNKDFAFSFHKNPDNSKTSNLSDSETRSFKIDLNKMKNQYYSNKNKDIEITDEEQKLIKDDTETDSDFEYQNFGKNPGNNTTKMFRNNCYNLSSKFKPTTSTVPENPRIYINEFGEESLLSESSLEDVNKAPKLNVNSNKEVTSYRNNIQTISNSYVPSMSLKKPVGKHLNPFQNREAQPKRTESGYSKTDSMDASNVPKINLNMARVNKSQVQNWYKSVVPPEDKRYSRCVKNKIGKKPASKASNGSFDITPSGISFKKHQKNVPKGYAKSKYSSCSFRNPQILNTANFALRRPSSTVETEQSRV